MILLSASRFLHLPKCGGCWVMDALLAACPNAKSIYGAYANGLHVQAHLCFPSAPHPDKVTFVSIRRPDDWLRSVWVDRVKERWQYNWPANRFQSDNFHDFVQGILDSPTPGFVDAFFYTFCGDSAVEVLPLEFLRSSLIWWLHELGEVFDKQVIQNMPQKNVSNYHGIDARWDEDQRREILVANQWSMVRWSAAHEKYKEITSE